MNRNYVQKKKKILSNRIRCDLSEVEVKVLKMVIKAVHLRKLVITQKKLLVQTSTTQKKLLVQTSTTPKNLLVQTSR